MIKKIFIILSFMAVAAPHLAGLGLPLSPDTAAFAAAQENGQPCPPECVTDSMEIVTWYPSPYNEYEELRLYPISDSNSACGSDTRGLMYYDSDEDKVKLCKGPAGLNNWQDLGGGGYWDVSPSNSNDIYYTPSGNVGIGTDNPQAKLHIVDTGSSSEQVGLSTTLNYTGGFQTYTVPIGIDSLKIDVYGAIGGNSSACPAGPAGGAGGRIVAKVNVTPGELLYVYVGGMDGYNGGGAAGGSAAGVGGGASDVRRGGTALSNRIIVAGGGGGGGDSCGGCSGGNGGVGGGSIGGVGGPGFSSGGGDGCRSSGGGNGGTQTAGGSGSLGGVSGSLGVGGKGSVGGGSGGTGGGGGGGYYGGGGGGATAWAIPGSPGGGGGGSSWAISTASEIVTESGININANGKVIITSLEEATLYVEGVLAVTGSKNFEISHPAKPGMKLVHSSLEGPEAGVYYRGQSRLKEGIAIVILPDYFEALTHLEDRTVQLTAKGESPFLLSYAAIQDGKFTVYGTNQNGEFSWEVKAVRKDIPPLVVEKE